MHENNKLDLIKTRADQMNAEEKREIQKLILNILTYFTKKIIICFY